MTEKMKQVEIIPMEWMEMMRRGLEEAIANYGEMFETINFDPFTVSGGEDPRTWDEITDQERDWILKELFYKNGFDRQNEVAVASYTFEAPDDPETTWRGSATVTVYETKRSKLDNMYLHEVSRLGCKIEYVVASKDHRI